MFTDAFRLLQFSRAIEVKQVAQQEAERSKFVVQKTEQVQNTPRTCSYLRN